jgi:hypothetical protein
MNGGSAPDIVQQAVMALRDTDTLADFEPLLAFFAGFVLESTLVQQIMRWDMVVVPPIFALPHPQPLSFERRGGQEGSGPLDLRRRGLGRGNAKISTRYGGRPREI